MRYTIELDTSTKGGSDMLQYLRKRKTGKVVAIRKWEKLTPREVALPEAMAQGLVKIEGNPMKVAELFSLFDDFTMAFEIVEPLKAK